MCDFRGTECNISTTFAVVTQGLAAANTSLREIPNRQTTTIYQKCG